MFRRSQPLTCLFDLTLAALVGVYLLIDISPDKASRASVDVRNALGSPPGQASQIVHKLDQGPGHAVAQSGLTTAIGAGSGHLLGKATPCCPVMESVPARATHPIANARNALPAPSCSVVTVAGSNSSGSRNTCAAEDSMV
jgi:hypothetical protein